MLDSVTGDDLFAQIQMLRTSDPRTIVLVEGGSDCDALDPHIDDACAQTIPGHSRTTVERAIALVDSANTERVVALVDRDWTGKLEAPSESQNLVYTDLYDLDASIVLSGDVLDRVLSSISDRHQRSSHLRGIGITARDLLVRLAGTVGLGRYVVARDDLEVRFRNLPIGDCTDRSNGTVDVSKLCVVAIAKSTQARCSESQLSNFIREEEEAQTDLEEFCSGHDLAAHMSSLIKTSWGGSRVTGGFVERTIRAAFDCQTLKSLDFYTAIREWATAAETKVWSCP